MKEKKKRKKDQETVTLEQKNMVLRVNSMNAQVIIAKKTKKQAYNEVKCTYLYRCILAVAIANHNKNKNIYEGYKKNSTKSINSVLS